MRLSNGRLARVPHVYSHSGSVRAYACDDSIASVALTAAHNHQALTSVAALQWRQVGMASVLSHPMMFSQSYFSMIFISPIFQPLTTLK